MSSSKIWNLLGRKQSRRPAARRQLQARLEIESLEHRLTPVAAGFSNTSLAVVQGFVYVDSNNNGVLDAGEPRVPGIAITLTGTTAQGASVNVSTTTDANGQYIFYQVSPGTYSLTRGSLTSFVDGHASYGNLGGTLGTDAVTAISVGQGQTAVNYNFTVSGLGPKLITLQLFLSSTTPSTLTSLYPTAGAGQTAADMSVQPTAVATTGNSDVGGTVVSASGAGVSGASVSLTGIDQTGRAVLETTTTSASGAFQFTALQPGTFTLNLTSLPGTLHPGVTTPGSLGGEVFQNGQISDIQLPPGANGTGYVFTELAVPAPAAGSGLGISAVLADDTAGPLGSTTDGITSDASIQGILSSTSKVTSFLAGFDSTPASVSVLGSLIGNTFFLNPAQLAGVAGGSLANGAHTLHLQATNTNGQTASFNLSFTLEDSPPTSPTLHMDTTSDPGQTGATTASSVTLQGQTSPGAFVRLTQAGQFKGQTTSSTTGAFSFTGIPLTTGSNDFTVTATDVAGNASQTSTFFVLETPPTVVPTAPVTETLVTGSSDQFVDLSSPTLFTDAATSNTIIRFNTSAGPINVELFDGQAPQTVANFLDYIESGDYNNDIFHRLVDDFVIQGGGYTFDPTTDTITALTAGPAVPSEFNGTPNVSGTIAMALTSNGSGTTDNNSATDEFFFNMADNTQTLDSPTNGDFTVFGQVLSGADQRVLNTLASATITDESSYNSAFSSIPLNNYSGTNFPLDTSAANYDLINSIDIVQQTQQLTYSIVSNSDTTGSVETASISFGQLDLHPVGEGTANVVVKATDKYGQSSDITFHVVVGPIAVTSPGNQSNLDGDVVNLPISATATTGGTLTYTATGLPTGLTINSSTGVISGTIAKTADTQSPYSTVVTATEGATTGTTSFTWTVKPVVAVATIPNQTNLEGASVSLQTSATDAKNATLTYTATNLPLGLNINSATGLITGTLTSGDSTGSPYSVNVTATDGTYSNSQSFTWIVGLAIVNPIANQTNTEGDSVSLQATGQDVNSKATLTWRATGLPGGLSINASTGLITGTVAPGDNTSSPYTVTVADTDGTNTGSQTFTWTVNPLITFSNVVNQTTQEGNSTSVQMTANDPKSSSLTYTATGLPTGLSINASTGLITGTVAAGTPASSPFAVKVTATDGTYTGNTTFTWTITPVVSVSAIQGQSNLEGDTPTVQVTATDADKLPLTYSATGLPTGLSIDSTSGLISGTIATGASASSPYTTQVTATDGTYSGSQSFTWTVMTSSS